MSHGLQSDPADLIEPRLAAAVAETLQALAAPSRLRILGRLSKSPCSVGELSNAVGMEPSAVSHQLRLLRHLGLVTGQRDGRHVVYELHDEHVSQLLGEAMAHVDHLRLGLAGRRERSALQTAAR
jgi:DNA-binding transcriptional ArsR family regulator